MLIRKSEEWGKDYGNEYVFDDLSVTRITQLEFSRGDIVGGVKNNYFFRVAQDENWELEGVMLDDEQMLELFAAYLKCKEEYDNGKA